MANIEDRTWPKLLGTLVVWGLASGCLFPGGTGHENFKSFMARDVGKSADDPDTYRNRYRSRLVGTRQLPDGNVEEQFARGSCPVFFEINRRTNTIAGWRYEGTEENCVIVP